jgi:hypothetical protein
LDERQEPLLAAARDLFHSQTGERPMAAFVAHVGEECPGIMPPEQSDDTDKVHSCITLVLRVLRVVLICVTLVGICAAFAGCRDAHSHMQTLSGTYMVGPNGEKKKIKTYPIKYLLHGVQTLAIKRYTPMASVLVLLYCKVVIC